MLLSKVGRPDRFPPDPTGPRPLAGATVCPSGAKARSLVLLLFRDHHFGHPLMTITSVALISANARAPFLRPKSRHASRVIIDVIDCPPTLIVTCASSPSNFTSETVPSNLFLPLIASRPAGFLRLDVP